MSTFWSRCSGVMMLMALYALPSAQAAPRPAPVAAPAPAPTPAQTDDISATERAVVRVVTVAIVNGEVVGFGHGSGFAIAPNRIVTNAHVVADAAQYPDNVVIGIVPSEGERSYPGRLIAIDRRRDLALIEIVEGRVPAASLFSGPVPQRQTVFALGYPGNVDIATAQSSDDYIRPRTPVASDGIVSSRDAINGVDALVHDADIARGNSGGPLVDRCGRVVGVNAFISRADEGDSPFSFAVTVRELSQFLQDAGQRFTSVSGACVTMAELRARDGEASAAAEEARRAAATAAERTRAEQLDALRADTQVRRETYMALAAVMFGGGLLAAMAAMMFNVQGKGQHVRAAGIAAGALAAGAVIVFVMRPDPRAVTLPDAATEATANPAASPRFGSLACRVDRDASRLTVSAGEDATLAITPQGCVNTRTQYVANSDGVWTRTLVPNEDATVSRMAYNPATGDYIVERFLLSLPAIQAARRERSATAVSGCTTSDTERTALARREAAITALLPGEPNERIVHRCVAD